MSDLVQRPDEAVVDKLSLIKNLIDSDEYSVAVKECCTLFEVVFRKIFQQAIITLPFRDRTLILETERRIGKEQKGVHEFGFGELVGLFRESQLLDKWSKFTSKDLGLIKSLDFSSIVRLRNRLTHEGASCNRTDANLVYEYLRNLLAFLGYNELEESINKSFQKQSPPPQQLNSEPEKETKTLKEKLPRIRKSVLGKSNYSPSYGKESTRLKIQGRIARETDLKAFHNAIKQMESKTGLIGLDIGCASGFVTVDRFSEFKDCFRHVFAIDHNEASITKAQDIYGSDSLFSFHQLDIESPMFQDTIENLLADWDEEGFDLIFSSLTIHHLANPVKALMKLRKLLKPGGYIILRGSDDGSKIAYPDEQHLVPSIIKLHMSLEGISDRENGRKFYNYLWKAGYRDIELNYNIMDTTKMDSEERYNLFEQSFSYRKNYFKQRVEQNPENREYQEEYEWITAALEELELLFLDASFYYSETIYIAMSKK